jgi:chromosomal replication initiation ATPase DnaA
MSINATPEEIIARLHPAAQRLLVVIATIYSVTPEQVVGHCRCKPIKLARHHWWASLYGLFPGWSYPWIGGLTGHDHTTVMNGHRKHIIRAMRSSMPMGEPVKTEPAPVAVVNAEVA